MGRARRGTSNVHTGSDTKPKRGITFVTYTEHLNNSPVNAHFPLNLLVRGSLAGPANARPLTNGKAILSTRYCPVVKTDRLSDRF